MQHRLVVQQVLGHGTLALDHIHMLSPSLQCQQPLQDAAIQKPQMKLHKMTKSN